MTVLAASEWATTVAAYCPGRMTEHPKWKSTGGFLRPEWSPCTVHQKEVQRKNIRQYGLAQRQDKELLFLIELGSKSPYGEGKITFRPLLGKFHEGAT